jgi:hypothetical protein
MDTCEHCTGPILAERPALPQRRRADGKVVMFHAERDTERGCFWITRITRNSEYDMVQLP